MQRVERPGRPVAAVAAAALAAVLVALAVLGATGGLTADESQAFDPGAAVRLGLPVARAVHDLLAAVTIGLLGLATWAVAPAPGTAPGDLDGLRWRMVRAAAASGTAWLVAGAATVVLTAADVSLTPVGSPGFGRILVSFVTQLDVGRALATSLLLALAAVGLAFSAGRVITAAWACGVATVALLPLALVGHTAGFADHANAVDSLALHLIGAAFWVGGLAGLLLFARSLGAQRPTVAARYSRLAGWCFLLVAGSGLINAVVRLDGLGALATPYGLLVAGKVLALLVLGVLGWLHRRVTVPQLAGRPSRFARLAAIELLVMGAAFGLAVALSRSAPPAPRAAQEDAVTALLGYPMPPPLTLSTFWTAFYPSVVWLTVAAALAGGYFAGMIRLRRRGDRWPWLRSVCWAAGCLLLVFVTSGGPAVYGRVMFSVHMAAHMSLTILVPLLLVLGAPVTLALRALRARTDGSFGPRETVVSLVHARPLRVLGHPAVAAALFTGSLVIFYYTDLFQLAMFTHTGHVLMTAHFLLVGYLFVWSLVGVDPGPDRPAYPFRVLLLLVVLGFHAFFGISLMASETLIAPDWWYALGLTDRAAQLADQQAGGAVAWAAGDLPALLLGIALVVGWVRSDTQQARRLDRQADRDGDAELRRYNEQLAALARRDQQP